MGWFHRKQNPGTGALIDLEVTDGARMVLKGPDGKVVGWLVFHDGELEGVHPEVPASADSVSPTPDTPPAAPASPAPPAPPAPDVSPGPQP